MLIFSFFWDTKVPLQGMALSMFQITHSEKTRTTPLSLSQHWPFQDQTKPPECLSVLLKLPQTLWSSVCSSVSCWFSNYFHWNEHKLNKECCLPLQCVKKQWSINLGGGRCAFILLFFSLLKYNLVSYYTAWFDDQIIFTSHNDQCLIRIFYYT